MLQKKHPAAKTESRTPFNMPNLIERSIARSIRGTTAGTKKRMTALARVRWVMATDDGEFVTVGDTAKVTLTRDARLATIYDARDNEVMKVRFMQALLRVQLTVVLLGEDWTATNDRSVYERR